MDSDLIKHALRHLSSEAFNSIEWIPTTCVGDQGYKDCSFNSIEWIPMVEFYVIREFDVSFNSIEWILARVC